VKAATSAGSSIASLAEERGIAPAYLVGAILKAEKAALRASGGWTDRQIEWELADIYPERNQIKQVSETSKARRFAGPCFCWLWGLVKVEGQSSTQASS